MVRCEQQRKNFEEIKLIKLRKTNDNIKNFLEIVIPSLNHYLLIYFKKDVRRDEGRGWGGEGSKMIR